LPADQGRRKHIPQFGIFAQEAKRPLAQTDAQIDESVWLKQRLRRRERIVVATLGRQW
jgi:hypothetical protein